jgi:pyruvate dehydrogenase E1 component alpha subunit
MKLENEQLLKLYTNLVRARKFDEAAIQALSEGKILCFFHSGLGHEAIGVGACTFLRKDDYIYPHHRGHGLSHLIGKGVSPKGLLAEHCGKATGMARGIAGFHGIDPERGVLGAAGTIGSQFPVSVGWALAAKKRGKGQVVVCFFGDGSSNRGTLHEAMNLAAVWKLPVVWVCENNLMAQFVPIKDAYPREDIADIAYAYGMPGVVVDGQDVLAVYEATQAAVERARAGDGPSLLECKTYRYRSHTEGVPDWSHAEIRSQEEIEAWKKRDPVTLFREKLLESGILTQEDVTRIDKEITAEVEEMERFVEESPFPDPSILEKVLYAD